MPLKREREVDDGQDEGENIVYKKKLGKMGSSCSRFAEAYEDYLIRQMDEESADEDLTSITVNTSGTSSCYESDSQTDESGDASDLLSTDEEDSFSSEESSTDESFDSSYSFKPYDEKYHVVKQLLASGRKFHVKRSGYEGDDEDEQYFESNARLYYLVGGFHEYNVYMRHIIEDNGAEKEETEDDNDQKDEDRKE